MSLTKVSVRFGNKWVRTNPDKAILDYPSGAKASLRLFKCSICGQYVVFAVGAKNRPHFRHNSKEETKDCEERTIAIYDNFRSVYSHETRLERHSLPLKLNFDGFNISFEIGFPALSEEDVCRIGNDGCVEISCADIDSVFKYKVLDRFNQNATTYLSVGNKPAREYKIELKHQFGNTTKLARWPNIVEGIGSRGCLFDKNTGRRIPCLSEITIDCRYYLLTGSPITANTDTDEIDVIMHRIPSLHDHWYLYEVCAKEYSDFNHYFFARYGYILALNSIDFNLLWPPCTEKGNIIKHDSNCLYFYLDGKADVKTFPQIQFEKTSVNGNFLLRIQGKENSQNISATHSYMEIGKADVVYTLERGKDNYITNPRLLSMTDYRDIPMEAGVYNKLPIKNRIKVFSCSDATVVITNNSIIRKRKKIKAEKNYLVENIEYGDEIKIYHGLDCVWKAIFCKKNKNVESDTDYFVKKLELAYGKKVKVDYRLGCLKKYFKNSPKMRNWLIKTIRHGWISEKALRLLRAFCLEKFRKSSFKD